MKDPKNEAKTEEQIKAIVAKNLTKDSLYYVKDGQFGVKGLGYTEAPTTEAEGKYKSSGYGNLKESINGESLEEEDSGLNRLQKLIDEILSAKK